MFCSALLLFCLQHQRECWAWPFSGKPVSSHNQASMCWRTDRLPGGCRIIWHLAQMLFFSISSVILVTLVPHFYCHWFGIWSFIFSCEMGSCHLLCFLNIIPCLLQALFVDSSFFPGSFWPAFSVLDFVGFAFFDNKHFSSRILSVCIFGMQNIIRFISNLTITGMQVRMRNRNDSCVTPCTSQHTFAYLHTLPSIHSLICSSVTNESTVQDAPQKNANRL